MDGIGAAVPLPQAVVGCRNVEKYLPTLASHVGGPQQCSGREIGENIRDTAVGELRHRRRGISLVGSPQADKVKGTAGDDSIRSRGGDDKVDLRKGGSDEVNCGKGRDTVRIKRSTASDGLVIKGSCERVRHK